MFKISLVLSKLFYRQSTIFFFFNQKQLVDDNVSCFTITDIFHMRSRVSVVWRKTDFFNRQNLVFLDSEYVMIIVYYKTFNDWLAFGSYRVSQEYARNGLQRRSLQIFHL